MPTYSPFALELFDTYLSGVTISALLVDDSYVLDVDQEFLSDVNSSGGEVAASGYTRQTLTSVSITTDSDGNPYVTCDDVDFGTFNWSGVLGPIFYIDTGTAGTSRLICADVEGAAADVTTAIATIYRVDTDTGFLLGRI